MTLHSSVVSLAGQIHKMILGDILVLEPMMAKFTDTYIDGILPKGPYPPCLRMADRALLAGYPRYICIYAFRPWWIYQVLPVVVDSLTCREGTTAQITASSLTCREGTTAHITASSLTCREGTTAQITASITGLKSNTGFPSCSPNKSFLTQDMPFVTLETFNQSSTFTPNAYKQNKNYHIDL